ncbi:hypothetical protein LQZ19_05560 [Treponema primitia]|uniref:hypothetical protein n=1 Tax=Treponema primitia TaxID=88058 RepID=UPI00398033B4
MAAREAAGTPAQAKPVLPPQETPPGGTPKDLPELREALIKSLNRDRGILASGIEKSLPWEWADSSVGGKLLIPVRDPLTAELLKKEYPLIRQILGDLWGLPLMLEVIEAPDKTGEADKEPDLAPQAELVRRIFRGTVVKKNSMEKKDAN